MAYAFERRKTVPAKLGNSNIFGHILKIDPRNSGLTARNCCQVKQAELVSGQHSLAGQQNQGQKACRVPIAEKENGHDESAIVADK